MKVTTNLYGDVSLLTAFARAGLIETLSFKTDIFEAQNGTEKRIPLRDKCRVSYQYTVKKFGADIPQFFNMQDGAIRKTWAVPIGHESQFVGNVTSDFIECNTSIYDFRENSLALLNNGSEFILIEIISIESNGLKISEVVSINNAELCPIRICYITDDINSRVSFYKRETAFNFSVIDEPEIDPTIPDQFLDDDIYFWPLLMSNGSLDTSIQQQQNIFDNELGLVSQDSDWLRSRYRKTLRKRIENQQQLYEFKDFLFRRQGRYRPFWLPSFERNLRLKMTGSVSNSLLVYQDDYIFYTSDRKHIAIEADNEWTAHTITASTLVNSTTVMLTISPSLNKPTASISIISYLTLHRLDADNIDITYRGAGFAESVISILEVGV
ncbi:hypothetical protein ACX1NY_11205 [Acinetobacter sp. ANC 4631]